MKSVLAVVLTLLASAPALAQVGGLTALPALEPGPNLLQNAGFETPPAGDGTPGWKANLDGNPWSIDGIARSGRASLKLAGADRQQWIPSAEQVVTLEPGYYTIEAWTKTANLGTNDENAGVRVCVDGRPRVNWWQCTPVARGTSEWTRLREPSIPVPNKGSYRVTVGAYRRPDGVAWFDDVALTRLRMPPLDAFLLYPNFRGMLFDDRAQTIRMALTLSPEVSGGRIRVSLIDESSGAIRLKQELAAPTGVRTKPLVAELDGSSISHGTYLLRAELVDATGSQLYRYPDYRIVKAPAKAREKLKVWYDEQNTTHLRGKPAFVIGLYHTTGYSTSRQSYAVADGWGNDRIAQAPINMLINYWLGAAPVPALEVYMDDLAARGIYYLQTVNFYYEDHPQYQTLPYPAAKQGEDGLNRWVARTLGSHKGLAGFYTADERPAEMIPKVFRQHQALGSAAPGSIDYVVLGDGWQDQAPLWRDALDVMGLDPYPITRAAGENNLAMVGEWTRLGHDAVKGSRPLWMVLQFFPMTSAGGWPSREDLHTMSWMSIIEGAKGLFYWSFGTRGLAWVKDRKEREQHWQDLVTVTKEIKALEPVLLAPDAALVAKESSGGTIRSLGKRLPDGTRYLFAYNTTGKPSSVTWTLADAAREVALLDGPRAGSSAALPGQPSLDREALSDTFGPYEVKRYRLK